MAKIEEDFKAEIAPNRPVTDGDRLLIKRHYPGSVKRAERRRRSAKPKK